MTSSPEKKRCCVCMDSLNVLCELYCCAGDICDECFGKLHKDSSNCPLCRRAPIEIRGFYIVGMIAGTSICRYFKLDYIIQIKDIKELLLKWTSYSDDSSYLSYNWRVLDEDKQPFDYNINIGATIYIHIKHPC